MKYVLDTNIVTRPLKGDERVLLAVVRPIRRRACPARTQRAEESAFDLMIACTASRAWDPRGGGDRRVQPRGADGQGLAFTPKGYAKTREAARRHERE